MEEEVRSILRDAVKEEKQPTEGLGTRIAALFRKPGLAFDIPEVRGQPVRPARFRK